MSEVTQDKRYLYILSEDDNDDLFYSLCLEKILGVDFTVVSRRLRRGGGITQVRRMLPVMLRQIQNTGHVAQTFFLVSLDNDGAQRHPQHTSAMLASQRVHLSKKERNRPCRHCELLSTVQQHLGEDCSQWPIPGAVVVPVEMLESWLLMISETDHPHERDLPLFPSQQAASAIKYHQGSAPPQRKDRSYQEKQRLHLTTQEEYCFHCAENLDVEDLSQRSPSFALFKEQVDAWPPPT